jgi:hypothetical protein
MSALGGALDATFDWLVVAGLGLVVLEPLARRIAAMARRRFDEPTWHALRWLLAGSAVLNAAGIWWGLPDHWAAIELVPKAVLDGLRMGFSHGWTDAYPPVHFYLLSVASLPWLALDWLGVVNLAGDVGETLLSLTYRSVSLVMAAGIVTCACLVGTRIFGGRAGLLGAAVFALVAPFLYYAKTANTDVPYLFWFAVCLVIYLDLLARLRLRDFIGFATAATLSVCTKDQAYGLFLLMPLPIVYRLSQEHRAMRASSPIWRALVDRRMLAAAVTSAVLFSVCHNLLFNWTGFLEHVAFIVGPGSVTYQVYDRTLSGWAQLSGLTAWLVQQSFGWPFVAAGVTGLALALASRRWRLESLWLLTPAVSYYLSFISVVLYNYDRFVLPICLVLSIFAGFAFDRALGTTRRVWRTVLVAGVFAYTFLYSGTVDVLMIRDGRYTVNRWLSEHVRRDQLIGSIFDQEYLPRLDAFAHVGVSRVDELEQVRPDFYVLNLDYARAVPPDSHPGALLSGLHDGSLGYTRAFVYRTPSPWPWLPGAHHDLTGPRLESRVFVILRNINPTIEIFQRQPGS